MKKRMFSLILVCALTLLLTGCGKVGRAEEAIAQIGTVTMESGNAITVAKSLFNALSPKQQSRVENADELQAAILEFDRLNAAVALAEERIGSIGTVTPDSAAAIQAAQDAYDALDDDRLSTYVKNYDVLVRATKNYQRQCKLIQQAEDAVAAIGAVTLESGPAIANARAAYNDLQPDRLTAYAPEAYKTLVEAEVAYEQLCIDDLYRSAQALYNQGSYAESLKAYEELISKYPNAPQRDTFIAAAADAAAAAARVLFRAGSMEAAQKAAAEAQAKFPGSEACKKLSQEIQEHLEDIRPKNGAKLYKKLHSGYGELTINAGDHDVCVKIESVSDPKDYTLLYVRANQSATMTIANGKYYLKYTSGSTWYGEEERFGSNASFSMAEGTLEYETTEKNGSIYYSCITVTLYTVIGGNLDTYPIPEEMF